MKTKLLFIALIISSLASAQNNFLEKIINTRYYAANGATAVCTGDIDGDGDTDVVSVSQYDFKLAWYENIDGQGTINAQNIISTDIYGALNAILADIDGDGDLDVVGAFDFSSMVQKIVWFENTDGEGNFILNSIITSDSHGARSICATDIDGDGDLDILAGSSGEYVAEDEVCWYENLDGQGNYGDKNYISQSIYGNVYSADFDGDEDMDVLAVSSNRIAWIENMDGAGNFGSLQYLPVYSGQNYYCAFPTDLDQDGDIDVLASSNPSGIKWYENTDGSGTFSDHQSLINQYGVLKILPSDLDGDDDMDIFASIANVGVVWYQNNNSIFEAFQIISSVAATRLHADDMEGDGDMDVFYISYPDKIAWNENINGSGDFSSQQVITKSGYDVRQISANYINSDNHIDIVSITFDDKIVWYENNNGGNDFSSENLISVEVEDATSVQTADLDSDGDFDVLSSSYYDNKIAWYENLDGEGNFGPQRIISNVAVGAYSIFVADIDGDGDPDVISASGVDNKIAWYENIDNQGNFIQEQIITLDAINANSVFAIDIDNDGDMDVLSTSDGDNVIAWYENLDGQGSFGEQQGIAWGTGVRAIFAADVDNDGDNDVVSSSMFDDGIQWYNNIDGEGTFIYGSIMSNDDVENVRSVYVKDLDGDNDMDIIVSCTISLIGDAVVWYENLDGIGSFSPPQFINYDYPGAISYSFAEDIDGDGDPDIISQYNDKISWYDNLLVNTKNYSIERFSISPNPTSNILKIHSRSKITDIKLYNCFGQKVCVKTKADIIDISALEDGVYFLEIIDAENLRGIIKVIKK